MKKAHKQSEPSAESLREMPEVEFSRATAKPNKFYDRYWAEQGMKAGPGRPKKGEELGPSSPHSIRVPDELWETFTAQARAQHITPHAALRIALMSWAGIAVGSRMATISGAAIGSAVRISGKKKDKERAAIRPTLAGAK